MTRVGGSVTAKNFTNSRAGGLALVAMVKDGRLPKDHFERVGRQGGRPRHPRFNDKGDGGQPVGGGASTKKGAGYTAPTNDGGVAGDPESPATPS